MSIGVAFITVVGILFALFTLCAAYCCNERWGGLITRFFITLSGMVFLTIAIIYLVVGGTLWLIPN